MKTFTLDELRLQLTIFVPENDEPYKFLKWLDCPRDHESTPSKHEEECKHKVQMNCICMRCDRDLRTTPSKQEQVSKIPPLNMNAFYEVGSNQEFIEMKITINKLVKAVNLLLQERNT